MSQSQSGAAGVPGPGTAAHGHIRSYVQRRSRITTAQQQALDDWLAHWSIPYQNAVIDLAKHFGNTAEVILEIGFGMGETTARIAGQNPGKNYLGIEVYPAGVGALLKQIHDHKLQNLRIIQHDAVEVLQHMIAPDSLAGVHIFFPDPWPKKRHHKRRLIQPDFVRLLASRMAAGACLHCATDWEPYAEQMLQVLTTEPLLQNRHASYAPRPADRPQTKFEARGLRLGHPVRDLLFERRSSAKPQDRNEQARLA